MRARDRTVGTLNVFRTRPQALSDSDITVTQTFADAAAIGLLNDRAISALHQLTMQLEGALTSRIIIEQAKGTIAEHASVSMDEAYARLLADARNHQTQLTTVAEAVVAHLHRRRWDRHRYQSRRPHAQSSQVIAASE